jgi:hypothetical protein
VARKNSLERPKPRKKPREEPGYVGWPVLFWLYRVQIITEHGQDVQIFINDQHGRIIIRQNNNNNNYVPLVVHHVSKWEYVP